MRRTPTGLVDDSNMDASSPGTAANANRPPVLRTIRRLLLVGLLGSVAVLLVLALLLLFDVGSRLGGQAAGTAFVVGAWSMLGFAILKSLDFSGRRGVRWALIVGWIMAICSTLAALLWLALIWDFSNNRVTEVLARGAGIFTIWTMECLLPLAFLSATRLPRWAKAAVWVCCLYAVYLGAMGSLALIEERWVDWYIKTVFRSEDLFFRIHSAGAIFSFCGLVVVAVLYRLKSRHASERGDTVPWRFDVRLTCPRCGCEQGIPVAGDGEGGRCSRCRLRIRIDVDEPRCACGYVLFKITADRCPECGREVPENDRWLAGTAADPPAEPDEVREP